MTRRKAIPVTRIGRMLRFARETEGMTQAKLADRSGVYRETISRIESGFINQPLDDTILDLAEALGVNARWLRGESDAYRPGSYFVYALSDRDGRALYVGLCANLQDTLGNHKRNSRWVREVALVSFILVRGERDARGVRDGLVASLIPVWNVEAMANDRTNLVRSA